MSRNSETDLIVIGSGIAGLAAALAAAGRGGDVLVLTAGLPLSGSSRWAQGGIAAAVGADDNSILHAADTMAVGAGLNDAEAVNVLVEDGRRAILELLQHGVPFDGTAAQPALGLEAGHSRRRILHAGGGATGFVLSDALLRQVAEEPRIHVLSDTPVTSLVTEGRRVVGVSAKGQTFRARSVLLATGGYAGLWG